MEVARLALLKDGEETLQAPQGWTPRLESDALGFRAAVKLEE